MSSSIPKTKAKESIISMLNKIVVRYINYRDMLCEPYGLSSIQAVILLDVYYHNKTKVTDICKRLNKLTNTVSPLVNRLVEKGFLSKEKDLTDSRVTLVSLTPKSIEITEKINVDMYDYTLPMFNSLKDDELEQVYSALKLLIKATEE